MGHINPLTAVPMYQWGDFLQFTRRFADASRFPPVGVSGSTYIDLSTNVEYFWDATQREYVARWMTESYPLKSDFPPVGRVGTTYTDQTTKIEYYWDLSRNQYVAKLGTEVYPTRSDFPISGMVGIIYTAQNTHIEYYWDATRNQYVSKLATETYAAKSLFPVVGIAGTEYTDLSTHIEYFWDTTRGQYVAKLATEAYANKGLFPTVGIAGTEYTDLSTSIKYMWDSTISDYTTDVTVAIGTMFTYTSTNAPVGYFVMDGRAFDTVKYSLLHNWLTANWENYSSGFIPDMQDVTVRGKNSSRQVGSYEADAMQDHAHNATAQITSMHFSISNTEVVGDTPGLYDGNGNKGHYDGDLGFVSAGINVDVQGMKSGNIASETRMKNKAVVFIIKATMRIPL